MWPGEVTWALSRAVSRLTIALWVSWMQAPWAFRADHFGGHLTGVGFTSWGTRSGVQILHFSVRSSELWVPFRLGATVLGWRFMVRSLSQPLLLFVWDFPICLVCRGCSATFGLFSEEIVPYVAVNSVCPGEEVHSRAFSVDILNWNLLAWNFWVLFCPVSASGYLLLGQFLLIYCLSCRFPVWLLCLFLRFLFLGLKT